MSTDSDEPLSIAGKDTAEISGHVEERSEKELRRLARRGLREIRQYNSSCDFGALFDGNYEAYSNRHGAEAAMVKGLRFHFREDKEVVKMALQIILEEELLTTNGFFRLYEDNSVWRYELVYGGAGEPSTTRHEDPYAKEKDEWKSKTKLDIFVSITGLNRAEWYTCEKVPVFFYPRDVAAAVGVHKKTATRHMREMRCLEEIRDPTHEGRGQPKIAFEYHETSLFDDGKDTANSSWIPDDDWDS